MASAVAICNMALAHIGAFSEVTAISPPDGSIEAAYCAQFYAQARTEMMEMGSWRFAMKRADLAETTNTSDVWAYAYTIPSDCIAPRRILRAAPGLTVFNQDDLVLDFNDRDSAPFDVEGDLIFTNETDAVLVYVRDVTDTTKFTPSYTTAISYLLASYLSGPIIKGAEGTKIGDAMRARANALANASLAASANSSSTDNPVRSLAAVRG